MVVKWYNNIIQLQFCYKCACRQFQQIHLLCPLLPIPSCDLLISDLGSHQLRGEEAEDLRSSHGVASPPPSPALQEIVLRLSIGVQKQHAHLKDTFELSFHWKSHLFIKPIHFQDKCRSNTEASWVIEITYLSQSTAASALHPPKEGFVFPKRCWRGKSSPWMHPETTIKERSLIHLLTESTASTQTAVTAHCLTLWCVQIWNSYLR